MRTGPMFDDPLYDYDLDAHPPSPFVSGVGGPAAGKPTANPTSQVRSPTPSKPEGHSLLRWIGQLSLPGASGLGLAAGFLVSVPMLLPVELFLGTSGPVTAIPPQPRKAKSSVAQTPRAKVGLA